MIERASTLYAATIPMGTTKKTMSQATGRPSKVGVSQIEPEAPTASTARRRHPGLSLD